jgi:hypothetical protein
VTRIKSGRQPRQPAVAPTPYERPVAGAKQRSQFGRGRQFDNYPLTPDADVRAIRQAERHRDEMLGADPEWWTGE